MYTHPSKRRKHLIDGKWLWTDSIMEAAFIKKLVANGFSGKWRRSRFGFGVGYARYTPDIELSINDGLMNRHALVEFKPNSVTEFPIRRRRAMLTVSRFYKDSVCLLYVKRLDAWYMIEPKGELRKIAPPVPGGLAVSSLSRPRFAVPIINRYGKAYFVKPGNFFLKKTADYLEFFVGAFFASPKYKRRRKRH